MELLHIGIIVFRTATAHTMAEIGAIPTLAGVTGVMKKKNEWLQFESVQRAMQSSGGTVGTQAEVTFKERSAGVGQSKPLRARPGRHHWSGATPAFSSWWAGVCFWRASLIRIAAPSATSMGVREQSTRDRPPKPVQVASFPSP